MTLRYHASLLSVVLLMVLNACSSGAPVRIEQPSIPQEPPVQTESIDITLDNRQFGFLDDPSSRSLEEIAGLSQTMIGYQPDVALEIIRSLESIPSSQLSTMIAGHLYDPEFTEWLELALQIRTLMITSGDVSVAAKKWTIYHYGHDVTQTEFSNLVSGYKTYFQAPAQVAVLLPVDGGLAAAAKAIRDGFMGAYLERPGESVIRFYSSGTNGESAIDAYLQAVQDGATQIVGPLRVESTRTLAGLQELSVPILLLNEAAISGVEEPPQTDIITSLLLSQAEEAAAIANEALAQQQRRAIVMVPNNTWGRRIETAFTSVFEQGGGTIIAASEFGGSSVNHNDMLTQLLKIDESTQRKTDLQSQLGIPISFEPTRRDDFDFIFLAASPSDGRELKPLLRFHDAGDVPVYAMGRVFSGKAVPASDQDLNGIVFPATAWQLGSYESLDSTPESVREGSLGNLYALGQDAWRVLPWLPLMQKDPDLLFIGEIGDLNLQKNGNLFRQPAWAQFNSGQPVPYQWPDTQNRNF